MPCSIARSVIITAAGDNGGEAERILGTCTYTLAALSIILTVVMLLFGRKILLLFGADAQKSDPL